MVLLRGECGESVGVVWCGVSRAAGVNTATGVIQALILVSMLLGYSFLKKRINIVKCFEKIENFSKTEQPADVPFQRKSPTMPVECRYKTVLAGIGPIDLREK
tara:strand:- start:315 stop:623 length:309 start_codon:yes stop_codon:yes gene_type:complete